MPFETLKSLCTRGITPEYRNDLIAFCSPRPNNWKWASWTYQLFFFKIHQWNCINYSHFFTQKSGYFESEIFFWHQKNPPKMLNNGPSVLGTQYVELHFCEKRKTYHSASKHTPRLGNACIISWHKSFFLSFGLCPLFDAMRHCLWKSKTFWF